MELKVNEKYKKLVRSLTDFEYQALKTSIETSGLLFPIIVNSKGIILDGHHRYKICRELKEPIKTEERKFKTPKEEEEFVRLSNLRRSLTEFEMVELLSQSGTLSVRKIADKLSVGRGTVERALKVIKLAPEEFKVLVREERLSINGAFSLVSTLEDEEYPVPEKIKTKFYKAVAKIPDPRQCLKVLEELRQIVIETNTSKALLANQEAELAKSIEEEIKDKYYTKDIKASDVDYLIRKAKGYNIKLKRVYIPWEFKDETEAEEYFKKFGGRFLDKEMVTVAVGEVDPT
jgi:ParB-like chromosome segregation protein Spo0J